MLIIELAILFAFAKGAVILLEDAAYGVRGKQSPRQRERAAHQAAERAAAASGQPAPPPPGGAWGRAKAAVGGYLAGVAEDATANARARKRRAQARRDGNRAIDGIFLDFAEGEGFYSDCDICGWSSRRYRIEANALAAGREHTRDEHPEHYHPDPDPDSDDDLEPTGDPAAPADETAPADGRPKLTLINGGAGEDDDQQTPAAGTGDRCAHDGCGRGRFLDSDLCLRHDVEATGACSFVTAAPTGGGFHRCGEQVEAGRIYCPAHHAAVMALADPDPAPDTDHEAGCHSCNWLQTGLTAAQAQAAADAHTCPTPQQEPPAAPDDDLMALAEATQDPGAGTPAGTGQQKNTEGSTTVNLEAMGADEIRAAFNQAITEVDNQHNELDGLAKGLAEAADEYEGRQMAATTVTEIREASEAAKSGVNQLAQAKEHLESALADFNARDGVVADTVADVGNLADRSVLVGS
jgi:hypothetical protein